MMEIKLRAWDKTSKHMINGYAHVGMFGELNVTQFHSSAYSNDGCPDLVLMLYSGLNDSRGREICDGDIILILNGTEGISVYFIDGQFVAGPGECELYLFVSEGCEVIGNKYENPGLLNGIG